MKINQQKYFKCVFNTFEDIVYGNSHHYSCIKYFELTTDEIMNYVYSRGNEYTTIKADLKLDFMVSKSTNDAILDAECVFRNSTNQIVDVN